MPFLKSIATTGDDESLLKEYKRTVDMQVLASLYQRYMELVYGVCLKYLKEPEDAKDAVLNIFEELRNKLLKHDVANFRPWLYQLAKNHCLMKLRSEKSQQVVKMDVSFMQSEEFVHLDGELEKEENHAKLEFCLTQLGEEQRKVIELFYLKGKCYNEITGITGMEWKKVRSYIQNGRRNLKLCMEDKTISIEHDRK